MFSWVKQERGRRERERERERERLVNNSPGDKLLA